MPGLVNSPTTTVTAKIVTIHPAVCNSYSVCLRRHLSEAPLPAGGGGDGGGGLLAPRESPAASTLELGHCIMLADNVPVYQLLEAASMFLY